MPRYDNQRPTRTAPHVPLGAVRNALGLTLDQVRERVHEEFPELSLSRGHLSAVESGLRGASEQMLQALEVAYGLAPESISTDYQPRQQAEEVGA